jgi:hypothetical protein
MAFFINSSSRKTGQITKSKSTYDSKRNYYIGDEKIIDTSIPSSQYGPNDYNSVHGTAGAAKIYITYVKSGYKIIFPSIIDSITDSLKPSFSSEQIYGFTDGVQKFSNTSRTISLSFKVLAYDEQHAKQNLSAVSALAQFMYPIYDGAVRGNMCNALVLREYPLLRLRWSNMIQRTGRGDKKADDTNSYLAEDGLLIAPTNLNFTPNVEAGFFIENDSLFPKEIKITLNCNVMHEETVGWTLESGELHWIGKLNENGRQNKKSVNFAWGTDLTKKKKQKSEEEPLPASSVQTPSSTPTSEGYSDSLDATLRRAISTLPSGSIL